jgi:heptaprenylglyceryl phosphate synthase
MAAVAAIANRLLALPTTALEYSSIKPSGSSTDSVYIEAVKMV